MKKIIIQLSFLAFVCTLASANAQSQRTQLSLDGLWEAEESMKPEPAPSVFTHKVPVPGLANQAKPAFKDADKFFGIDYLQNTFVTKSVKNLPVVPPEEKVGVNRQPRNYYWYRTSFTLSDQKEITVLRINKAQFGTAVWINGKKIGNHNGCFTSASFDISDVTKKNGKNELVIRIGAHPGVLSPEIPTGSDYEKVRWQAGIYDDVSIISCNNPFIESIQVSPDISKSRIIVQSKVLSKKEGVISHFDYQVNEWRSGSPVGSARSSSTRFDAGRALTITDTILIPSAHLWSPESPFLYTVTLKTGGDEITARFGMRDFHFDTPTKRAFLNGKIYFLRGTNITLHRFFDDSLCGSNPWNETWVRKLLTDIPKQFNWNAMRFCIGPVPDKWLDIADETGLLIQNEYFIWPEHDSWSKTELKQQVNEWMTDCWNHPSVAWWDICNENNTEMLREIIRELHPLDISDRAWDNGYGFPVGKNDPIEDHHYLNFSRNDLDRSYFESNVAAKTTNSPHPSAHACVLNEYGWLWLKRNGEPTVLSKNVYDRIAPGISNEARIELYAYQLALETEYFRAHRNYAGVLHFTLLTGDFEHSITGDLFQDPVQEVIHPAFEKYLVEAFRPLGVFVNVTRDSIKAGTSMNIPVMLVNDSYKACQGKIKISNLSRDTSQSLSEIPFSLDPLGAGTWEAWVTLPKQNGNYELDAVVQGSTDQTPTICRRKIKLFQ